MTIRAAIFDMDGVVVDNHPYHFKAWMEFADRYNFELNEEIYRDRFNGKTNRDLFEMIFDHPSEEEIQQYIEEKEGVYQELYENDMQPLEGLLEFLDFLKARRIKIALGTSAPPGNVDFILDNLDLRHYFDVIVDGTDVERGKPDPQVYELCADKLGVDPRYCVVFEDSLAGLESAERAGCQVVGVATSHEPHELEGKTLKIIREFTEARRLLKL